MCLSTDMLTLSSSVSRESRTFLLTKQSFTLPTNLSQDILLFLKARQSCGVPLVIHGDRSESWHRNFCIGLLDHKSLHYKLGTVTGSLFRSTCGPSSSNKHSAAVWPSSHVLACLMKRFLTLLGQSVLRRLSFISIIITINCFARHNA